MKVRDIIEDARSEFAAVMGRDAKWEDNIYGTGDNADPCGGPTAADAFIAAFSPEHLALMEAVCEASAVLHLADEAWDSCAISMWETDCYSADWEAQMDALVAYRAEHGYTP